MDEEELAEVPDPPSPPDPARGSTPVVDDEVDHSDSDPDSAQRDVPAGEDYAGSGF